MNFTRFDVLGDVRLRAISAHLPEKAITTAELFSDDPTLAANLIRLTGIESRRYAAPSEATSDMAIAAARPLLALGPVDRLLLATVSPDYPSPATAPLVQHALGLPQIPAMDLSAACAGFGYAIDLAARCALTGDRGVIAIAAEVRSRAVAAARPGIRCLFGDGAAAGYVALGGGGYRILATMVGADGTGHQAVRVEAGGTRHPTTTETIACNMHSLAMEDGPTIFFTAIDGFVDLARKFVAELSLTMEDIDLLVPHQANVRILERVARRLNLPTDKTIVCVQHTGNVGGASAGLALAHAEASGRIRPGARILLLTAGAGYTMAAVLLEAPTASA